MADDEAGIRLTLADVERAAIGPRARPRRVTRSRLALQLAEWVRSETTNMFRMPIVSEPIPGVTHSSSWVCHSPGLLHAYQLSQLSPRRAFEF
jgi:hypothetical protein